MNLKSHIPFARHYADELKGRILDTQILNPILIINFSLLKDMADRDLKGDQKDTKVEDEMIAGDEDGNDEVTITLLKTRQ